MKDVCRLYANTTPFYIRDSSICCFGVCRGPGSDPLQILSGDCISESVFGLKTFDLKEPELLDYLT